MRKTKKTLISDAVTNIDTRYIEEAAEYTAATPKRKYAFAGWIAAAACFCLLIAGVFLMRQGNGATPVTDDLNNPVRGEVAGTNTLPGEDDEQVNVYKIDGLGIDANYLEDMQTALYEHGWAYTECTLLDEYDFVLKGSADEITNDMNKDECTELAKAFLEDSGLNALIKANGISYKFVQTASEGLVVTCCYFLYDGENTGAYIRFIFEDYKCIGEIQAHIYNAECLDALELLTLDEALAHAYKVNADGILEEIDAENYNVKGAELVYVRGLPYYRFNGYGINTREVIDGYALAVDIYSSDFSDVLTKEHELFKIN